MYTQTDSLLGEYYKWRTSIVAWLEKNLSYPKITVPLWKSMLKKSYTFGIQFCDLAKVSRTWLGLTEGSMSVGKPKLSLKLATYLQPSTMMTGISYLGAPILQDE